MKKKIYRIYFRDRYAPEIGTCTTLVCAKSEYKAIKEFYKTKLRYNDIIAIHESTKHTVMG